MDVVVVVVVGGTVVEVVVVVVVDVVVVELGVVVDVVEVVEGGVVDVEVDDPLVSFVTADFETGKVQAAAAQSCGWAAMTTSTPGMDA